MDLKELIKFRIGEKDGQEYISDYDGFDMSKTHSQEEFNEIIDTHNKRILNLFKDYGIADIKLDCWKGMMFLGENMHIEKDFSGWTSSDIIYWLIKNKSEIEETDYIEEKEIARIITKEDRYAVLKRQKWRCNQCGCQLKYSKDSLWEGEVAHIDHIFPYSKRKDYLNGEENINELPNLQALCPKCNKEKGKKEIQ